MDIGKVIEDLLDDKVKDHYEKCKELILMRSVVDSFLVIELHDSGWEIEEISDYMLKTTVSDKEKIEDLINSCDF